MKTLSLLVSGIMLFVLSGCATQQDNLKIINPKTGDIKTTTKLEMHRKHKYMPIPKNFMNDVKKLNDSYINDNINNLSKREVFNIYNLKVCNSILKQDSLSHILANVSYELQLPKIYVTSLPYYNTMYNQIDKIDNLPCYWSNAEKSLVQRKFIHDQTNFLLINYKNTTNKMFDKVNKRESLVANAEKEVGEAKAQELYRVSKAYNFPILKLKKIVELCSYNKKGYKSRDRVRMFCENKLRLLTGI